MKYDYSKLRGRIVEKFKTVGQFADSIGMSRQTVSNTLAGKTVFTQRSIEKWREALEIPFNEINVYFFSAEC